MLESWVWMSAAELGRGIEIGAIDPVALTQHFIAAAEGHEFSDRIFARLTADRALSEAQAAKARAEAGQRLGLLDGVPISWKDLFDTANVATEAGSALLKGRVPAEDCPVLARAGKAGLVCLGKTHMSELAFSGLGYNPVTETPPCINDLNAVSGGSSSGAAASVAFGLSAAAIGSDTGGSIRVPSAWNDLVGFKTTSGLIPLEGVVPLAPSFDTVGPLTRTVEDAALITAILAETEVPDISPVRLDGLKLGVLETLAFDDIRAEPLAGFTQAREKLEAAGVSITAFQAPAVPAAMGLADIVYNCEAYGIWENTIEAQPDLMFDQVCARFRIGKNFMATEYVRAWRALTCHRLDWRDASAELDAVIIPSAPIMPPALDRVASDEAFYRSENLLALRNTRIGNLMGLCAVSMPTGVPSTGMMVMGQAFEEAKLLRICASLEKALKA
ncbi:MAG: amidase family protein [Pseudomonadota bacterium]